jgi:DNA-binding winged helix-turn-helix (wHTH) protein
MAYRFGPFLYDPVSRGLLREGVETPLTHKGRELLLLFLHHPGRMLTHQEISERVWPDVAITDDAVRFQVVELRKAFGSDGKDFIRTVRREGYRWEAPVRAEARSAVAPSVQEADGGRRTPRYRLVLESREVQLLEGENVIGRDPDAVLWIDHASVSRRHARIVVAGVETTIEDLGSKNGTFLRGKKLHGPAPIADGDKIRVGPETMVFRELSPGTTQAEREGPP